MISHSTLAAQKSIVPLSFINSATDLGGVVCREGLTTTLFIENLRRTIPGIRASGPECYRKLRGHKKRAGAGRSRPFVYSVALS